MPIRMFDSGSVSRRVEYGSLSFRAYWRAVDGISCIKPVGVGVRTDVGDEGRFLRDQRRHEIRIEAVARRRASESDPSTRAGR